MASVIALHRIERLGRHHVIHAIVEILDGHLRLFGRKIAVLRILGDLGIAQPPQRAVLVAHDRPEMLEAGAAERWLVHEQEIAAPEALARDRAVGLGVDGEEDARRAVLLPARDAPASAHGRKGRHTPCPGAAPSASAARCRNRCCRRARTRTAPVWTTSPTSRRYSPKFVGRFGFGGGAWLRPRGCGSARRPAATGRTTAAALGVGAGGGAAARRCAATSCSGGGGGRVTSGCSTSNHW